MSETIMLEYSDTVNVRNIKRIFRAINQKPMDKSPKNIMEDTMNIQYRDFTKYFDNKDTAIGKNFLETYYYYELLFCLKNYNGYREEEVAWYQFLLVNDVYNFLENYKVTNPIESDTYGEFIENLKFVIVCCYDIGHKKKLRHFLYAATEDHKFVNETVDHIYTDLLESGQYDAYDTYNMRNRFRTKIKTMVSAMIGVPMQLFDMRYGVSFNKTQGPYDSDLDEDGGESDVMVGADEP